MTARHYIARIEKAELQYQACCGQAPQGYQMLAKVAPFNAYRDQNCEKQELADALASGKALRGTVTGKEGLCVYVDPK